MHQICKECGRYLRHWARGLCELCYRRVVKREWWAGLKGKARTEQLQKLRERVAKSRKQPKNGSKKNP